MIRKRKIFQSPSSPQTLWHKVTIRTGLRRFTLTCEIVKSSPGTTLSTMSPTAFVFPVPLHNLSTPLTPLTQRRCRYHRFHNSGPCASIIDSTHRQAQIDALETRLRSLDASSAADLAYVTFTTNSLPPTWQQSLDVLCHNRITGTTLSRLASRLGFHALFSLSPETIPEILQHLSNTLSLTDAQRNRIITHRPDILRTSLPALKASTDALLLHLKPRDLKHITLRWPGILLLPAHSITRTVTFLSTRPCLLSSQNIRCLLRRAPWILVYDVDRDMAPVIFWLRDQILPYAPDPLSKYLLASPQLLGTPRANLHQVIHFLRQHIRMKLPDTIAVVRQFPPILTCSPETVLCPAIDFLSREVGLEHWQIMKVVRAFPAVLTLDVEADMKVIVDYFRSRGISNVARLVTRLPPVLGYDLETDIIPKTEYIEKVLGLSIFDILRFPAYFSHDLRKRIEPRTRFLQHIGVRIAYVGLNVTLSFTDRAFCERIGASVHDYYAFKKACYRRRRIIDAAGADTSKLEGSGEWRQNNVGKIDVGSADISQGQQDDSEIWHERVDTSKRRKKRFRATLTRMPWAEMRERSS